MNASGGGEVLSEEEILRQISLDRALGAAICFPHRHPQKSPPSSLVGFSLALPVR